VNAKTTSYELALTVRISGLKIHDARIAALCQQHGVSAS
jgi:predicted nucleic acid-binding protein